MGTACLVDKTKFTPRLGCSCNRCERHRISLKATKKKHRLRYNQENCARNIRYKKIVFEHYGNKCACCGETTYEFLSIDHVNNDGNKERKSGIRGGSKTYKNIIDLGFPSTIQILCFNCNCSKGFSGYCPHKKVN